MEAVQAGEYIELRFKYALIAFLTFLVLFYLKIFRFETFEFIFEIFCIIWIVFHLGVELLNLTMVGLKGFAEFFRENFDFDVIVKVKEKVINFEYFWILCQPYHLANLHLLLDHMNSNLQPKLLLLLLIVRLSRIFLSLLKEIALQSKFNSFRIQPHHTINHYPSNDDPFWLKGSECKIHVKIDFLFLSRIIWLKSKLHLRFFYLALVGI